MPYDQNGQWTSEIKQTDPGYAAFQSNAQSNMASVPKGLGPQSIATSTPTQPAWPGAPPTPKPPPTPGSPEWIQANLNPGQGPAKLSNYTSNGFQNNSPDMGNPTPTPSAGGLAPPPSFLTPNGGASSMTPTPMTSSAFRAQGSPLTTIPSMNASLPSYSPPGPTGTNPNGTPYNNGTPAAPTKNAIAPPTTPYDPNNGLTNAFTIPNAPTNTGNNFTAPTINGLANWMQPQGAPDPWAAARNQSLTDFNQNVLPSIQNMLKQQATRTGQPIDSGSILKAGSLATGTAASNLNQQLLSLNTGQAQEQTTAMRALQGAGLTAQQMQQQNQNQLGQLAAGTNSQSYLANLGNNLGMTRDAYGNLLQQGTANYGNQLTQANMNLGGGIQAAQSILGGGIQNTINQQNAAMQNWLTQQQAGTNLQTQQALYGTAPKDIQLGGYNSLNNPTGIMTGYNQAMLQSQTGAQSGLMTQQAQQQQNATNTANLAQYMQQIGQGYAGNPLPQDLLSSLQATNPQLYWSLIGGQGAGNAALNQTKTAQNPPFNFSSIAGQLINAGGGVAGRAVGA